MSRYRVLIAEDEATYAKTVARYLEERGHEVKVCPSSRAAERALKEAEWDVLLLDLNLPDARGVDLLARVRQDHAGLQTIIVTGFAAVESAIETMRLGAFDYLTKPPNFAELAVRVERAGEKALRALELRPDYGEAHANLAVVLWNTGRQEEARRELEAQLHGLGQRQRDALAAYDARLRADAERLAGASEEQKQALVQLRADFERLVAQILEEGRNEVEEVESEVEIAFGADVAGGRGDGEYRNGARLLER